MAKLKVGDKVDFKKDVEGRGEILEIREPSYKVIYGDGRTFVVAPKRDEGNCERWHPESRYDYDLRQEVVYLTIDDIF